MSHHRIENNFSGQEITAAHEKQLAQDSTIWY